MDSAGKDPAHEFLMADLVFTSNKIIPEILSETDAIYYTGCKFVFSIRVKNYSPRLQYSASLLIL